MINIYFSDTEAVEACICRLNVMWCDVMWCDDEFLVIYRVMWSVGRLVCHNSEPCKNGWTDRHAVWLEDWRGPKEPRFRWGSDHHGTGQFWEGKAAHCEVGLYALPRAVQKWLKRSRCRWDLNMGGPKEACVGCTLAQPGEYHWTVHVRRRCGMLSSYFDHLLPYSFYIRLSMLTT